MSGLDASHRANLVGSVWMIAAMAGFAVEDVFLKTASQSLPVTEVLLLFGLGGMLVFALAARLSGARLFIADVLSPTMRVRGVFEVLGRMFYMLALALTPLSATTVILQATPLVVVASAAVLFGERVGWRRWGAILLGLSGVVIILRPGTEGFSALSMLAVLGMLGFAGRDLASRAAPLSLGTPVLGFYGFLSIVIAGALFQVWEAAPLIRPDAATAACLVGAVLAGSAGYAALMKAMRTGEVSAVTPFRYTRLLFGITFGVVLFGERLDLATWVGSGLIVLSGLFILWRGQRARAR